MEKEIIRKNGDCHILKLPKEVCSIEFTDLMEEKTDVCHDVGISCRGEMVIAHMNEKGQIIEIELVGDDKPCSKINESEY